MLTLLLQLHPCKQCLFILGSVLALFTLDQEEIAF